MALGFLVAALFALGCLPLVKAARRSARARVRSLALPAWLAASAALGLAAGRDRQPAPELRTLDVRPLEIASDGYVSSDSCQACHPDQYDSWRASYHRTMTQVATGESVLAPFDGRELVDLEQRSRGARYVPFHKEDELWVELDDPEWTGPLPAPRVERQVVQTTGSHHQQLYWLASGHSRALLLLPHGYRIDEGRWRPVDAIFLSPPRGVQSTVLGRWNSSCSKCHATHGQPRFRSASEMDTHVAELGIACESCHGPGAEHVALNRNPLRRYRYHESEESDGTIVNPADLPGDRASQVCGQCHGVTHLTTKEARADWVWHGFAFRPGDDLFATRGAGEPDAEAADRKFWSDGELRVTGREYNALARTPCFRAGEMSCLSCHRMHQAQDDPRPRAVWRNDLLAPGMDGDQACTQCHAEYLDEPALVAHTHHGPGSSGSRCLECHMPRTTYGLLGAIRTHEVRPPDAKTSLATGRPNACNQCHLDRTLEWTARRLEEWYGIPAPELPEEEGTLAASVLWTLKGEAGQRALMAWSFGWPLAREVSGSDWALPYLALLMNDPYHAVRFIAHRSARSLPAFEGIEYDYLDPPEKRLAATELALERWAGAQALAAAPRPELLLGPGGTWLEERVDALLQQRNLEDIVLQE